MFNEYRILREMEGPKAGDEGELLRLELEMMLAGRQDNKPKFLDRLTRALLAMDGCGPDEIAEFFQ